MSYFDSSNSLRRSDDVLLPKSTDLNKSYLSSDSTSQTNSKAVLAALRALQDKIRRLETERSQALDECQALRHQLRQLEIDADHAKQKDNLVAQRNLQEARVAYDKLQHEKTELEIRYAKIEESNRLAQSHSDELTARIRSLEDEKHNNLVRIKELESQNLEIESRIESAHDHERGKCAYPSTA
jgi:chromosome segregation ATPase